jgi:hypothetical protein
MKKTGENKGRERKEKNLHQKEFLRKTAKTCLSGQQKL